MTHIRAAIERWLIRIGILADAETDAYCASVDQDLERRGL
jgi:hypothetical protein